MCIRDSLIGGLILGYIWQYVLGDAMSTIGDMTGLTNIFFNWLVNKDVYKRQLHC